MRARSVRDDWLPKIITCSSADRMKIRYRRLHNDSRGRASIRWTNAYFTSYLHDCVVLAGWRINYYQSFFHCRRQTYDPCSKFKLSVPGVNYDFYCYWSTYIHRGRVVRSSCVIYDHCKLQNQIVQLYIIEWINFGVITFKLLCLYVYQSKTFLTRT